MSTEHPDGAADLDRQIERLLRHLVTRSVRSWDHNRTARLREALQQLEDVAAAAEGRSPHPVPDVGQHALVDQLQVLLDEAARAGVPAQQVAPVVSALAEQLAAAG